MRLRGLLVLGCLLVAVAGCSDDSSPSDTEPSPQAYNQALHDELLQMFEEDQAARTGGGSLEGDTARTDRLGEIIDRHGWPTYKLVGEDGAEAAWAIAQHSDLDPAFQERALELLREAVAAKQGSPGNLAYLEDRVAVSKGDPQKFGTQIRCGPEGPRPTTPIEDEAGVEQRRATAGLDPLTDYMTEMTEICAASGE